MTTQTLPNGATQVAIEQHTMSDVLDPLSLAIGKMQSTLDSIQRTQGEDRLAAAQYRTDVRKELETVRGELGEMIGDFRQVKSDVATIKPKVETLERKSLMSTGAANMAIAIGKTAHVLSILLGGLILFVLQHLFGVNGAGK